VLQRNSILDWRITGTGQDSLSLIWLMVLILLTNASRS